MRIKKTEPVAMQLPTIVLCFFARLFQQHCVHCIVCFYHVVALFVPQTVRHHALVSWKFYGSSYRAAHRTTAAGRCFTDKAIMRDKTIGDNRILRMQLYKREDVSLKIISL